MPRTVVVGASLAGLRTAEALRREGDAGELVVVGDEPHQPYDRPPLSKQVLAGAWTPDKAALRQHPDLGATWRLGERATGLDLEGRAVLLGDERLGFDRLVVATGAAPRRLPGTEGLGGVFVLRGLDDCAELARALDAGPRVCVVGAGFIGAEVASTARARGLEVTVVEAVPLPLERLLGRQVAEVCAGLHRAAGTDLRLGVGVERLEDDGTGHVRRVRLADGSAVEAEVVVVGIGVRPSTGWLEGSGLLLDDGVVCDRWLRALREDGTPAPGVAAVGDVCRWEHPLLGRRVRAEHWSNAVEQAGYAARTLVAGPEGDGFGPVPYFWSDQYGHKLQHVGDTNGDDEVVVVDGEVGAGPFCVAYGRGGRLVGAFGLDRPRLVIGFQRQVAEGAAFPPP